MSQETASAVAEFLMIEECVERCERLAGFLDDSHAVRQCFECLPELLEALPDGGRNGSFAQLAL